MYCRNFAVLPLFDVKKQRPKTNLQKCYQCSVDIEISLDLKVYFSLVTCKINNLIALRLTNQITEISAPWWLIKEFWHINENSKFKKCKCNMIGRTGILSKQWKLTCKCINIEKKFKFYCIGNRKNKFIIDIGWCFCKCS